MALHQTMLTQECLSENIRNYKENLKDEVNLLNFKFDINGCTISTFLTRSFRRHKN